MSLLSSIEIKESRVIVLEVVWIFAKASWFDAKLARGMGREEMMVDQ